MKQTAKEILLIDDNESDNFFHTLVIEKVEGTKSVHAVESAISGLEFLKNRIQKNIEFPDIIFLDINMPAMNGWEFMDEFQKLPIAFLNNTNLYMLTTSINPMDRTAAKSYACIKGFLNKPLLEEHVVSILKETSESS